jgi:pimeloyl-ACP methyl ester carboxylesterase
VKSGNAHFNRSGSAIQARRSNYRCVTITKSQTPYLLVGHSFGGIYQYAFAKLYPEDVSAILLVDATHPEHWENMQRRTPNTAAILLGLRAVAFSETERQEFDAQGACISGLAKIGTPAIPARLLLRGKAGPFESAEFQAMSRELAARWPELLPGMTMLRVDEAGHHIQKDNPGIVAREINTLVAAKTGAP